MEQSQVIKQLKDKVEELQDLLKTFIKEDKQIGTIIAGPVKQGPDTFYRCQIGQQSGLFEYKSSVLFPEEKLKEGAEVIILKSGILGAVPDTLKPKEEAIQFDHIKWSQIGGLKSQVERIRESIELPLNNADLMREYGLEPIKGILLYGAPGCGKTLIAKAIASVMIQHSKAKPEAFVYLKGGDMLSMYVGGTEQHIGRLFKQSRKYAQKHGHRAVIFIDEADALLPARGTRISSDVETTIVPTFLSEMDGFDKHSPIMILATNFPQSLDPAILREGRIDIKVEIGRPTKEDAAEIFAIHLNKVKTEDNVEQLVAEATHLLYSNGLTGRVSGALIETIVKLSTQRAVRRALQTKQRKGIIFQDIQEAILSLY